MPEPIIQPDIELHLAERYRALRDAGGLTTPMWIGSIDPDMARAGWLLRITDPTPTHDDLVQDLHDVRLTLWGPADGDDAATGALARVLLAHLTVMPDGDPITAVLTTSGPGRYRDDSRRPARLITASLLARGTHL